MKNKLRKRLGFASYDFSNSGYVAVFQSFLFPIVLAETLLNSDWDATYIWALIVAASSILAVAAAPFLGRLADELGKSRVFMVLVISVGLLATIAMPLSGNQALILICFFLVFNWFFELSQSLYDSFLVDISDSDQETTEISSFAWGFGYLGGALFAVLYFAMLKLDIDETIMLSIFGILFLLASLPAIRYFSKVSFGPKREGKQFSIKDILNVKNPVPWADIFIYWVIADTVAAVLYFAPIFLKTDLELGTTTIGGILLVGQLVAFPATIFMGKLAGKIGRMKVIRIGLIIWAMGLMGLYFSNSLIHVVIVFLLLSLVVGSTQSLLRAHFADRVEAEKSGEGLGFFAIAQKSASIIAPLLVVGATYFSGSIGPAFIVLAVLIFIAYLLSKRLN